MPGLFDKLKSKAQGALASHDGSSSNPGQGLSSHATHADIITHGGQQLNVTKAHLQSQNARTPQPVSDAQPQASLPPKVKNVSYHEPMTFYHPSGWKHNVMRDLGFSSVLDGRIIWTWGDTLMGTSEQCMICACDSTSIGTLDNKLVAIDTAIAPGGSHVANWIDCNEAENKDEGLTRHAFGGTNIVEVAPGKGVVYYLKNYRPGGTSTIKGAGIATVTIDDKNIPHSTRVGDVMWNGKHYLCVSLHRI
jgi:hypothetical protein